jgi:dTDP-4-amino-4,6-dideoxygalactose transaminase
MMPLTTQPVVKPYLKQKYHAADYINKHGLLIGCHQFLDESDLDYIVESIKEFYR